MFIYGELCLSMVVNMYALLIMDVVECFVYMYIGYGVCMRLLLIMLIMEVV